MKLNKIWKAIIGLFSLWVAIIPFLAVVTVFSYIPIVMTTEQSLPIELPFAFYGFMIMMFLLTISSFLQMCLSVFYLTHIILNKKGIEILRILFGVGTFLLPYVVLPVYYFIYILPENPPEWALTKVEQS